MILTIAIIAGIGYILSFLYNLAELNKSSVSVTTAAILVISTWSCLPLAITIIAITLLIYIVGIATSENKFF
jgi:hypothetical protein